MNFDKSQIEYIKSHGGVIAADGHITIRYKDFRKIHKDYAARDICDRRRHVWLLPGAVLLVEGRHFTLVK